MEIIDVITFNGEFELLDLRLNILSPYVDKFIIVEFDKTFSGKDKPFYGKDMNEFLKPWKGKVDWHYNTEKTYSKYKELAESSPNTKGAEHWKTEFMMKESIKDCLTGINDDDIIMIGDCDEIWNPTMVLPYGGSEKLLLRVYTYYLNNLSSEKFYGTLCTTGEAIKQYCLNHLRNSLTRWDAIEKGWHFTSMGGSDRVKEKLTDSYTKDSYATKEVLDNLEDNIKNGRDFLGRDFHYATDESEWPQYLKDNKEKYKHLLK